MSTKNAVTGRRGSVPTVLAVAGGALAAATWIGGAGYLALFLVVFYAVAAVGAWIWAGRDTDTAAIMRGAGDERQRTIDRDAMAIAGLVMVFFAIAGAVVSAALDEGDIGVFGLFAAVGATTYAVAVTYFRRHR